MVLYLRRASESDVERLRSAPSEIPNFFFSPEAQPAGDLIDFDKAWQALHFTLSGAEYYTDNDLGILLFDGEKIGEDMGYGAGWIIPNHRIVAFNSALSAMSDDDIRARYNPAEMSRNDIYIADAFEEDPEQGLQYLMQGIPALRQFAEKCTASNSSAIAAIC